MAYLLKKAKQFLVIVMDILYIVKLQNSDIFFLLKLATLKTCDVLKSLYLAQVMGELDVKKAELKAVQDNVNTAELGPVPWPVLVPVPGLVGGGRPWALGQSL